MSEATFYQDGCALDYTPVAAVTGGEVIQLADGRAAVLKVDAAASELTAASVEGVYTVDKTANIVFLDGGRVYWDHSANKAHFKPVNDRDFYVGVAVGDATSASTTMKVALNVEPKYILDAQRDESATVIVKTVVGSTTVEVPNVITRGGTTYMTFGTTAEAQKVDLMTVRGFAPGANAIVEGIVNIITNGDNAAVDFNIGVANATHATDFDAITEFVSLQTDGNSLNINAQSDDGTTDTALVDTTVDFVAGTPFEFWMDFRNPADVQLYIDGVNVLPASTFSVSAATGPLKLIAHLEKTSDDSPGTYTFSRFAARLAQQ